MALMMARLYTGNYDVIALRNAYHGLSTATMGLNGQGIYKHGIPQVFKKPSCQPLCFKEHILVNLQSFSVGMVNKQVIKV